MHVKRKLHRIFRPPRPIGSLDIRERDALLIREETVGLVAAALGSGLRRRQRVPTCGKIATDADQERP